MIISASYKTDIPTFYGDWLMNRLVAGYCKIINPYRKQIYRVSLLQEDVDGLILWTKNIGPFLHHLPAVRRMGLPFVIQHTINGYPRALETSVVDSKKSVDNAAAVREVFGARTLVWRYDTIVFSSLTPHSFHIENFGALAESLRGITDEVVISFAHLYKKTRRNLETAAGLAGFDWWDPEPADKRRLASELVGIARTNGMQLTVCSQRELMVEGAGDAHCVDARRIEDISGRSLCTRRKGNREDCGCFESRDIGEYDTCPHGCTYCYAVHNRPLALERYRKHNPDSEFLFDPTEQMSEAPHFGDGTHPPQFKLFEPN